jgi:hypothetical protein
VELVKALDGWMSAKRSLKRFTQTLRRSCFAARKPRRVNVFHDEGGSPCVDQSHGDVHGCNVMIPIQKRICALRRPQKRNDRDRSR